MIRGGYEQLDTEFTSEKYGEMKKVYSIWLCPDTPKKMRNAISEYCIMKRDVLESMPDEPETYDKLSVIVAAVNSSVKDSEGTEACDKVSRLLKVILSNQMAAEEKVRILMSEYQMESNREGELKEMCNLSDLIEERGIEKGIEQGRVQERVCNIRSLMNSLKCTPDYAMDVLGVPASERVELTEMLD